MQKKLYSIEIILPYYSYYTTILHNVKRDFFAIFVKQCHFSIKWNCFLLNLCRPGVSNCHF